jgi:hypothetical protein
LGLRLLALVPAGLPAPMSATTLLPQGPISRDLGRSRVSSRSRRHSKLVEVASGEAPPRQCSGPRGRRFESSRPDQIHQRPTETGASQGPPQSSQGCSGVALRLDGLHLAAPASTTSGVPWWGISTRHRGTAGPGRPVTAQGPARMTVSSGEMETTTPHCPHRPGAKTRSEATPPKSSTVRGEFVVEAQAGRRRNR